MFSVSCMLLNLLVSEAGGDPILLMEWNIIPLSIQDLSSNILKSDVLICYEI